ncbi:hypothetical protein B7494_g4715 [Chlorociboria aeruginascens]|nr:hypothetical protein B7494_g4715 [Chlorociboria aeruginascens]
MDDEDTYEIPLQDQRIFGAGIKRKRVHFVPSSSAATPSPRDASGQSISDMYLNLVLPKDSISTKTAQPVAAVSDTQEGLPEPAVCDICNLPLSAASPETSHSDPKSRPHEASLAHQVCLTHSHPPSHLDRHRKGLAYLSSYGWDPDSRLGLGAKGEGIKFPIKLKEKDDKLGIGAVIPNGIKKKEKGEKLDAGKLTLLRTITAATDPRPSLSTLSSSANADRSHAPDSFLLITINKRKRNGIRCLDSTSRFLYGEVEESTCGCEFLRGGVVDFGEDEGGKRGSLGGSGSGVFTQNSSVIGDTGAEKEKSKDHSSSQQIGQPRIGFAIENRSHKTRSSNILLERNRENKDASYIPRTHHGAFVSNFEQQRSRRTGNLIPRGRVITPNPDPESRQTLPKARHTTPKDASQNDNMESRKVGSEKYRKIGDGVSGRLGQSTFSKPVQNMFQPIVFAFGAVFRPRNTTPKKNSKYGIFEGLVTEQYISLLRSLSRRHLPADMFHIWGIDSYAQLTRYAQDFETELSTVFRMANDLGLVSKEENSLFYRLKHAFVSKDVRGLSTELEYSLRLMIIDARSKTLSDAEQRKLADFRFPYEWYPATRAMQRTIHLHVGPTNSGKTYHALQRLEAAESGIYAGPLRLLAHEVYTRFNAKGKPCALITGEELRIPEGQTAVMSSCTVEMVPLNAKVDVAVIDEIQMMGDYERGWAWTQAFLGIQAKEVHLCGEIRTIPLIEDLCASIGDKLIIHKYKRLSPLAYMPKSLDWDLTKLKKGDAVILFSRMAIHDMKNQIESITGKRCAVVYGSLPPETRAQQANLFNKPNNDYDFLVASDAVGMGLNLAIRRIIFETTSRYDGKSWRVIPRPEIKQIAGRAGRYRTARDAIETDSSRQLSGETTLDLNPPEKKKVPTGFVTTLGKVDLPIIKAAMDGEVEPLKSAGIFPPASTLERFAAYFPRGTPFSYITLRLHAISSVSSRFHLCTLKEQIQIADAIEKFDLRINERIIFSAAPVSLRDSGGISALTAFARCVAEQSGGNLLDIPELNLELLQWDKFTFPGGAKEFLRELEALHKALTLYMWLSYRFAGIFPSQRLCFHVKSQVEAKIDDSLAGLAFTEAQRLQRLASQKRTVTKLSQRTIEPPTERIGVDDGQNATDSTSEEAYIPFEGEKIGGELHTAIENGEIDETEESPSSEAGVPREEFIDEDDKLDPAEQNAPKS